MSEGLKSDAGLKTASEDLSAELGRCPKIGFLRVSDYRFRQIQLTENLRQFPVRSSMGCIST